MDNKALERELERRMTQINRRIGSSVTCPVQPLVRVSLQILPVDRLISRLFHLIGYKQATLPSLSIHLEGLICRRFPALIECLR